MSTTIPLKLLSRIPANSPVIADSAPIQWCELEPLGFDKTGDFVALGRHDLLKAGIPRDCGRIDRWKLNCSPKHVLRQQKEETPGDFTGG